MHANRLMRGSLFMTESPEASAEPADLGARRSPADVRSCR
jgi:hypothetical protein